MIIRNNVLVSDHRDAQLLSMRSYPDASKVYVGLLRRSAACLLHKYSEIHKGQAIAVVGHVVGGQDLYGIAVSVQNRILSLLLPTQLLHSIILRFVASCRLSRAGDCISL